MKNYYYAKQGEDAQGPFSTDALKKLLSDGAIAAEDMVCEEGAEEWRTLASVFPPEKKWKEWMDKKVVVAGIVALLIGGGIGYALHPAGTASGKAGIAKNGIPVELKSEQAKKWYRSAMKGDAEAQCKLGDLYSDGDEMEQMPAQAFRWYLQAAGQEHAGGLLGAAWCYRQGFGVKHDAVKAYEYTLKAAELGSIKGMLKVAICYEEGDGVAQNDAEYVRWVQKAAEAGSVQGMVIMSALYSTEQKGIERDLDVSEQWARKAKDAGYEGADNLLTQIAKMRNCLSDMQKAQEQPQKLLDGYHAIKAAGLAKTRENLAEILNILAGIEARGEKMEEKFMEFRDMMTKSDRSSYDDDVVVGFDGVCQKADSTIAEREKQLAPVYEMYYKLDNDAKDSPEGKALGLALAREKERNKAIREAVADVRAFLHPSK